MGKKVNKNRIIVLSLFICLMLFLGWVGYIQMINNKHKNDRMKGEKVLIIGIDGFDPKIVSALMEKGMLPNIKSVADEGSFFNLSASNPSQSPVAWATIASGVNPGKHGIFDFMKKDGYTIKLSLSGQNEDLSQDSYTSATSAAMFWKITSDAKIPTTVIRWPLTFPPEKIEGVMLSGLGVPDIKGFLSGYTYYTTKDITSDKHTNRIIKIIPVQEAKGVSITTQIYGPKIRKEDTLRELTSPITIKIIDNSVFISTNEGRYEAKVSEWSGWIKANFKISMFESVSAIFKVYIQNSSPFDMYLTAVQINPKEPLLGISYPEDYSRRLAEDIGLYYTLGMPEETDGYSDGVLSKNAFLAQIKDIEDERYKMFWKEFENFKKSGGVYAFVFDSSDRMQHLFWDKNILGNLSSDNPIISYYLEKDEFIGEVSKKIDDNTTLIILSDHGFSSFDKSVNINNWLLEKGYMQLTDEIINSGPLFKNVDWEKTKAYSLGFNSIYLNLKNRDPNGIVKEDEKDKLIGRLIGDLEKMEDIDGAGVIVKAYRKEDIYFGSYLDDAPDIIIGFNEGYRMNSDSAIGGFSQNTINENIKEWKGDHMVDPKFVPGVLISNKKLNENNARQVDILPTILDILNTNSTENSDGESLLR